jgi:dihydroorotate dehydrogenase
MKRFVSWQEFMVVPEAFTVGHFVPRNFGLLASTTHATGVPRLHQIKSRGFDSGPSLCSSKGYPDDAGGWFGEIATNQHPQGCRFVERQGAHVVGQTGWKLEPRWQSVAHGDAQSVKFSIQPVRTFQRNVLFSKEDSGGFTDGGPSWVRDAHVPVETGASLEGWRERGLPMGLGYRLFARPLIALQDSEKAHKRSLKALKTVSKSSLGRRLLRTLYAPRKTDGVSLFGHHYNHPFGLAAGMDKNGEALLGWESLGLAFIEIGGVTMLGQDGNPKPRMFRSSRSGALVNRMGFNNQGSEAIQQALDRHVARHGSPGVPLWVNLGKSKVTSLEEAHLDYATTMERLWVHADVFVINVSSPNTPNLRTLQNDEGLKRILHACHAVNERRAGADENKAVPLLVKIAPDVDDEQLALIVRTAQANGAAGMVVSNTTLGRPEAQSRREQRVFDQQGGLSGQPVKQRSTALIRQVRALAGPDWPIVGVGGVADADDAWEKILAGATLVQAYSGFVFQGPSLVKNVVHGLHRRLLTAGQSSVKEAVGSASSNAEDC